MVLSLAIPGFSKSCSKSNAEKATATTTGSTTTTSVVTASATLAGTSTLNSSNITEALRSSPFSVASRSKFLTSPAKELEEKRLERQELNDAISSLAELFPDVKIEVFRELLVRFDGKSRLHVCVEQLLRYRAEWVKGRWNVPTSTPNLPSIGGGEGRNPANYVPEEELFRSEDYKTAVKAALSQEFRGLSRSVVDAVLAEVNSSYTRARPTLRDLSRKSWRVTFGNIFPFRKKNRERDDHPLLAWQRLPDGDLIPRLKETGCAELDRELHDLLLAPLLSQKRDEQEARDWKLAEELNQAEANAVGALYECDCCLAEITFEQISTCSVSSHVICFNCIQRTTREALFGQGWSKSIDPGKCTLRCLAPLRDDTCEGSLDPTIVKRAILTEKAGVEMYHKFEDRLAAESLLKSQLKLIRCPFCSYAEVDPVYHPSAMGMTWRFRRANLISTVLMTVFLLDLIPLLIIPVVVVLLFCPSIVTTLLSTSLRNICLKTRTQRFTCSNPTCRRDSCITCHKLWRDPHICHEPLLLSLRTTVEAARTAAIKRTCPRCGLSFVKSSGCNKLTCVCGYSMCYLCRKALGPPLKTATRGPRRRVPRNQENMPPADHPFAEIPEDSDSDSDNDTGGERSPFLPYEDEEPEGYKHFCDHFRVNPGSRCTECTKCDLYLAEDEEAVARRAGEKAEREWRIREGLVGTPGFGNTNVLLDDAIRKENGSGGGPWDWDWQGHGYWKGRWRYWMKDIWRDGRWKGEAQALVDQLMERIVVADV